VGGGGGWVLGVGGWGGGAFSFPPLLLFEHPLLMTDDSEGNSDRAASLCLPCREEIEKGWTILGFSPPPFFPVT